MNKNYKLDKQVITNFIHWYIQPIFYYIKLRMSNLLSKNNTNFPKTFLN